MLFSLLAGITLIIGVMFLGNWLMQAPKGSHKRRLAGGLIPILLVVVAGLAITGRLGLALATLAAMAPWVLRGVQMWQAGRMIGDLFRSRRPEAQNHRQDQRQDHRQDHTGSSSRPPPSPAMMDRDEALRVLGLPHDAGPDDIHAAYRRLMAQVHPDKGGSDWMAAKLNEARDRLLPDRR